MPEAQPFAFVQVALWALAGVISLYFSIGNARIWTSISTGFFLVFVSEGYRVAPWISSPRLAAIHAIVGTVAIMVLTYGFQEYYVFSRTLEAGGSKAAVYLTTLGVLIASMLFLLVNPEPSPAVIRHIRLVANANWVFLSLVNLDMIRKIQRQIRGTPMAHGFVAFAVVLCLVFLWRGSELYLQVYAWDADWARLATGASTTPDLLRVHLSEVVNQAAGILASLAVGATFLDLYRRLR